MIRITLDTNLINVNQRLKEVNVLEALNREGIIKIVGTDRLLQETQFHTDRRDKANSYENVGEPYTVGVSRIGYSYISGANPKPKFSDISLILFPSTDPSVLDVNQQNDVMHLLAHYCSGAEYFVTNDVKDFIDARKDNNNRTGNFKAYKRHQLKEIGILVFTLKEILEVLEKDHGIK